MEKAYVVVFVCTCLWYIVSIGSDAWMCDPNFVWKLGWNYTAKEFSVGGWSKRRIWNWSLCLQFLVSHIMYEWMDFIWHIICVIYASMWYRIQVLINDYWYYKSLNDIVYKTVTLQRDAMTAVFVYIFKCIVCTIVMFGLWKTNLHCQ